MSNDKILSISYSYKSHCGIDCWKELMERRGVVVSRYQYLDYRTLYPVL